jgi:hypothetical protein
VRRLGRAAVLAVSAVGFAACGNLQGTGGLAPPLAAFSVTVSGDLTALRPPGDTSALRLALVWGDQWLTEPFCFLPPEAGNAAAADVINMGCRDTFGFVAAPHGVAASVPLVPGDVTTLTLAQLPSAEFLVGDITARIAYGSLVVFADVDGDQTLGLSGPQRTPFAQADGDVRMGGGAPQSPDIIYGASFVTMTEADRRVSYREGGPPTGAFYPRAGCDAPKPGFRVVGAGGFTVEAGKMSVLTGMLPLEDPTTCTDDAPGDTTIDIPARAPSEVQEAGCVERTTDSSTRYVRPPATMPGFDGHVWADGRSWACAHLPSFDAGDQTGLIQFVVSGRPGDRCKGLTHYTMRGCRESVSCTLPDWDLSLTQVPWWPCPLQ